MKGIASVVVALMTACGTQGPDAAHSSAGTSARLTRPTRATTRIVDGALQAAPGATYREVAIALREVVGGGVGHVTVDGVRRGISSAPWNPFTVEGEDGALSLSVVVDPRGLVVSASGVAFGPGCTPGVLVPPMMAYLSEAGGESAPEVPEWPIAVPPDGLTDGSLTACLRTISAEFTDESQVVVSAHAAVPWSTVAKLIAVLHDGYFPDIVLSATGPCRCSLSDPCEEVSYREMVAREQATTPPPPRRASGTVHVEHLTSRDEPGAFDASAVDSMLRRRGSYLQRCYERTLRSDPNVSGDMTVEFVLEPRGNIQRIRLVHDTIRSEPLADCITGVIRRLRFHEPSQAAQTFLVPLRFEPGAGTTP